MSPLKQLLQQAGVPMERVAEQLRAASKSRRAATAMNKRLTEHWGGVNPDDWDSMLQYYDKQGLSREREWLSDLREGYGETSPSDWDIPTWFRERPPAYGKPVVNPNQWGSVLKYYSEHGSPGEVEWLKNMRRDYPDTLPSQWALPEDFHSLPPGWKYMDWK